MPGLRRAGDFWVWLTPCLPCLLWVWGNSIFESNMNTIFGSSMQMLDWVGSWSMGTGRGHQWVTARDLKPSVFPAESEVSWVAD